MSYSELVRNAYKVAWLRSLPRPDPVLVVDPPQLYDLYCDGVNGSDDNAGNNSAWPFKTIAKLMTQVTVSGVKIALARGSHWREQMNLPVNNTYVCDYGSGALPILDCSDIAPNTSFTSTAGGYHYIYQINVTPDWYGLGQDHFNAWEDDVILPRVANLAALEATPGACYQSGIAGLITLYVHASDSSAIPVNSKVYTYSQRRMSIYYRNYSGCTITNVHTQKNLYSGGSLVGGVNTVLDGCTFSDGNAHNVLIESGTVQNCLFDESYIAVGSNAMLVFNKDTCNGETCTVSNCTFQNVNTSTQLLQAIYGHHNVAGDYGAVSVTGCTFLGNIKSCIAFNYMASLTISGCNQSGIAVNGPNFTKFNYAAPYTLIGNTIYTLDGTSISIDFANMIGIITGNTFVLGNTGSAAIYCAQTGTNLTLTGNTVNPAVGISGNRVFSWFTQTNNTIYSMQNNFHAGAGAHYTYFCPNGITTFASDYNTFDALPKFRWTGGVTYNGLAAWQAATGFDLNSI